MWNKIKDGAKSVLGFVYNWITIIAAVGINFVTDMPDYLSALNPDLIKPMFDPATSVKIVGTVGVVKGVTEVVRKKVTERRKLREAQAQLAAHGVLGSQPPIE